MMTYQEGLRVLMMKRKHLNKTERQKVYQKTKGHCAYCGCSIAITDMQIDHVFPLHRGGADEYDNMLPACRSCNHRKHTLTVDKFRAEVEKFPAVLERDSVTYKNAVRFGLVIPNPHSVVFYFERMES